MLAVLRNVAAHAFLTSSPYVHGTTLVLYLLISASIIVSTHIYGLLYACIHVLLWFLSICIPFYLYVYSMALFAFYIVNR